jgi:peptidoglycan/LPS O-acetylase OafA/YrhL
MNSNGHIKVLDGWRGMSILLVLAAHLLPLGPKSWELNFATGVLGMVIFFILSGFLITSILLTNISVPQFLARRFFRVIPLAWLYCVVVMLLWSASPRSWVPHFLFYANLPPEDFIPMTEHIWSLCVEVQFYVAIAIWFKFMGVRGLYFLPWLALCFTALRAWNSVDAVIATYYRIDEILAGCTLALIWHGHIGKGLLEKIKKVPLWLIAPLLIASCLHIGKLYLFRPYFAALLVAVTMLNPESKFSRLLSIRPLLFAASISYALYVIHPMLAHSWLGSGDILEKYAKRPILLFLLVSIAYISTHFYELRWIDLGKSLSRHMQKN